MKLRPVTNLAKLPLLQMLPLVKRTERSYDELVTSFGVRPERVKQLLGVVEKRNPYHDADGKFTSRSHAVDAGPAESQVKSRIRRTYDQIIDAALPDKNDADEFRKAQAEATRVYDDPESTTKFQHTKPGTQQYTEARLKLHRQIINHLLENDGQYRAPAGEKPTLTILGGRGGSGKSNFDTATNKTVGVYDAKKSLLLDSDRIKELLPEYHPEKASMVHEEAGDILDKTIHIARKNHLNVVLDTTFRRDFRPWIKKFKSDGYKVEGYFIHRPEDLAQQSAIRRWKRPTVVKKLDGSVQSFPRGRIVPLRAIGEHAKAEKNFDRALKQFSKWAVYDNSEQIFHLRKVSEGENKQAWEVLQVLKSNPYHDKEGKFAKANAPGVRDVSHWKRVGAQGGSNPGGIFEDEHGTRHYVKHPQVNPDQAKAEKVADDIYRALDIPAKESEVITRKGKLGLAGKMLPQARQMNREEINASPDVKKGYVADAFLGNWDVFGLSHDNIVEAADKHHYRVDNGGTLFYRAQGKPKDFPHDRVDELDSLIGKRSDGSWQKGHYAYGNLPKEEIQRQAQALASTLTDSKLESIVKEAGITGPEADRYLKALKGRREVIRNTFLAQKLDAASLRKVLKFNPEHLANGEFAPKGKGVASGWYQSKSGKSHLFVNEKGIIAGGNNKTQGVPAEAPYLGVGPFKSKEEAIAGKHHTDPGPVPVPKPAPMPPAPVIQQVIQAPKEMPAPPVNAPAGELKYPHEAAYQKAKLAGKVLPTGKKTTVTKEASQVQGNGHKILSHVHQFYDIKTANEQIGHLKDAYSKHGFEVVETNPKPGQVAINLKNTMAYVSTVAVPEEIKPVVPPTAATPPPVKVPAAVKPPVAKPAAPAGEKPSYNAKQVEKYKEQYAQKFPELTLMAKSLKSQGKNSAAQTKLNQLVTVEKTLAKYGMSPEDLEKYKSEQQGKFDQYVEQQKDHAVNLALAVQTQELKSKLTGKSKYHNEDYVQALNAYQAHTTKFKGVITENHLAVAQEILGVQKYKALQSIATAAKDKSLPPGSFLEAVQKAKEVGATQEEIETAHTKALVEQPPVSVTNKEQALEHLKSQGVGYYLAKNHPSKHTWNMTDEETTEHESNVNKLKDQFDAAKALYVDHGGPAKDLYGLSNSFVQAASNVHYQKKKEQQALYDMTYKSVKVGAQKFHASVFQNGLSHPDTQEALAYLNQKKANAHELLAGMGYGSAVEGKVQGWALEGHAAFTETIKEQKAAAYEKVKNASYDYEFKHAMMGPDDPETRAAKAQLDHAAETEKKYVSPEELEIIQQANRENAAYAKKTQEQLANLAPAIKQIVANYDKEADSFKFPAKSSEFAQHATNVIASLEPGSKAHIVTYTGGGYKLLNKQVGGAAMGQVEIDKTRRAMMYSMDKALQKNTLGYNVLLQRTFPTKYMWQAFGMKEAPATQEQAQALIGKVYTENAYGSTTMEPGTIGSMAASTAEGTAVFKIRAGKQIHGIRVQSISQHPNEKEVILARGMTYVIKSVKKEGNKFTFEVDAIGDFPKTV
jgi:predicted ABC-type ATPase